MKPWEIWLRFGGVDNEHLDFFTKLKRLTNKSEHLWVHINRKIGLANGTWSGENLMKVIFAAKTDKTNNRLSQVLQVRSIILISIFIRIFNLLFVFLEHFRYENIQLPEHHSEWFMHEYSLHQDSIHQVVDSDYVLCRLSKNERLERKLPKNLELQQHSKKRIMAPSTIEQDTMSNVTIDQDFSL